MTCSRLVVEPGIQVSTGGLPARDRIEPAVKSRAKEPAKAVRLRFTVKRTTGWKEVKFQQVAVHVKLLHRSGSRIPPARAFALDGVGSSAPRFFHLRRF